MRAFVSTTRRHEQPALAALVAWLCLFLQASGFAHGLLVRHAVCFEHGEIIHAPQVDERALSEQGAEVRVTAAALPSGEVSGAAAVGAQRSKAEAVHEHEHCAVFSHRRDALAAGAEARWVAVSPPAGQITATLSAGLLAPRARSLLLLAPKTSPPA